jgi:RHS repeat-associated protein
MDHSPWFDAPDIFDQRRIVLADIDGSGTTDILYLSQAGVQVYFNQSGNSWSAKQILTQFPAIDTMASVTAIDLLGNGTACLVWSSSLPGNGGRVMRYIDLLGGQKPYLLVKTVNNLGAETTVTYAPSTKFYVQDKLAGNPWITKIPFPVHVVEKVTVTDKWRQTTFSTTYSYHHGYFDGIEREFRGFGRVEQVDVESYGEFERGNSANPYITDDKTLYQPPMKTVTWHHTGVMVDRDHILSQYEKEYFPHWFEAQNPDETNVLGTFQEKSLPEPDLDIENLTAEEWREALRACKGMMLRQEVYELDVDALEVGEEKPVKLYSTAYHNCHIQKLQSRGTNRYGVFLVTESEAITYHYELDLSQTFLEPDPRIAHTLNLKIDDYGNVLESVAVAYPRLKAYSDATLPARTDGLITQVQQERHLVYTENTFTNDVDEADHYRLRLPCEVKTYELTGIHPASGSYYTLADLQAAKLRETVPEIPYHEIPDRTTPQKRRVEQVRMLYFSDDLQTPLPWGELNTLGLPFETYKLALTDALLTAIFEPEQLTAPVRSDLDTDTVSGYLSGATLAARFPDVGATSGQYWVRSGIAGFATDAADHFYLPERYTDPFGQTTTLAYDPLDLFVQTSTDPVGNTAAVTEFNYRVLAPLEMQDPNGNLSEVVFDVLGMPTAMAIKGKGQEGDSLKTLTDDVLNLDTATRSSFFSGDFDEAEARRLLDQATARHIYYFGEEEVDGTLRYGSHPPCAAAILREQHVAQLKAGQESPLQVAFEYSDGGGTALMTKAQAEPETPGGPRRWVANGKTILNNKGKPVKQYEPYFSSHHRWDSEEATQAVGVTPILYYDAIGRLIRTESPDGSHSRVEFSPWHVTSYDPNDTVLEPGNGWFAERTEPSASAEDKRAAQLTVDHANTPANVFLDSLGRDVVGVAHNRVKDAQGALQDEQYVTFTKLDIEGKPLWIRDDRGNLVMQYVSPAKPTNGDAETIPVGTVPCYDIAGNLLCQHSMDAGTRWMLNNATGNPLRSWDSRNYQMRYEYDALQRPTHLYVQPQGEAEFLAEKTVYGESLTEPETTNHRGQVYQVYDSAGVVTSIGYDFKGNVRRSQRQLLAEYKAQVDWSTEPALEAEPFTASTEYDALNRPTRLTGPDQSVTRPVYNEANLLEQMHVQLPGAEVETAFVKNIDYNAKGQRTQIEYGSGLDPNDETVKGVTTTYTYDEKTFRLMRLRTGRSNGSAPPQDLRYTYDPVGNITHIRDAAMKTVTWDGETVAPISHYTYDALYRLTQAKGREHAGQTLYQPQVPKEIYRDHPFGKGPNANDLQAFRNYSERYTYDSVGNILAMAHEAKAGNWQRAYEYATDSNQLLRTSLPSEGNGALPTWGNYSYDAHGSMTQMPHLPQMQWDYKDQLHTSARQVVNNGGTPETTYYVYDASGERVRKVTERQAAAGATPTRKNERIYLGGYEIYREYNGDGTTVTLERETLHVMDDQQRIALVETKTVDTENSSETPLSTPIIRYQLGNHLGSVSLELDADGAVISYEEYHPYGTTAYQAGRSAAEVGLKRYRYTGKERDEETGLAYHGARYYAPWLGKWTAADPAGLVDGLNLYKYGNTNPIFFSDPSGTKNEPQTPEDWEVANIQGGERSWARNLSPHRRYEILNNTTGAFKERAEKAMAGMKVELHLPEVNIVGNVDDNENKVTNSEVQETIENFLDDKESDSLEDFDRLEQPDPMLEDWNIFRERSAPHLPHVGPWTGEAAECLAKICHLRHPNFAPRGKRSRPRSNPGKAGQSQSSGSATGRRHDYTDHTGRKIDAKKRLERRRGTTEKKGQERERREWRDQHMRGRHQHHDVPDVMKADKRFMDRLREIGINKPRDWIDRQMSDLNSIQHKDLHAGGYTDRFKTWASSRNYEFSKRELLDFIRSLKREFGVPKQSSPPRYKGPQRR